MILTGAETVVKAIGSRSSICKLQCRSGKMINRYFILCSLLLAAFHIHDKCDGYHYTTNYITAPVDHFSFTNNDTFELKYLVNDTFWDVEKGPIFFYTGNEAPIENFVENTGFIWETAPEFGALIVFAEHRYYGDSMPYGNASFANSSRLGYLTSQQALADFVDLIAHLQRRDGARSSEGPGCGEQVRSPNPVIAIGGSYGGMLAAWFRIKYPASVLGAIASSAPIWYFTGMTPCNAFFKMTSSVYRRTSDECGPTISASWRAIDNVTETESGKTWLTDNWRLCKPLKNDSVVKDLKNWATDVYVLLAMANYPYEANFLGQLPAYPIKEVCKSMTNHSVDDRTLLTYVFRGLGVFFNNTGSAECLDFSSSFSEDIVTGWDYQACSEMVMPMCVNGGEDDIFEASPWNFDEYAQDCEKTYGVKPVVDAVEKQYGGKNLKAASNIIFTNGLLDPWTSGGVLRSISPTVRALLIPDAAHHLDLRAAHPEDPSSVIEARKTIKRWIKAWLRVYRHGMQEDAAHSQLVGPFDSSFK